jgi:hypothetical protein
MASNGRLPASDLAPIFQGQLAKASYCAASWNAMNVEARRMGVELRPTGPRSSYRTYDQQVQLWNDYQAGRGALAARPGTSNHGLGLAVDVATQQMRTVIDRIGRKYGWAKEWSDAPSEWWHIRHRSGIWSGPDPGPKGGGAPAPPPPIPQLPEGTVALAVATMADGRFELFVEDKNGRIWHTWQAKNGGWAGAAQGRRAQWWSLGNPGN